MIDQIYNQWLSYYYLPPETEKNLVPLLKPQYLVLAFIFARIIDAISDPVVGFYQIIPNLVLEKVNIYADWRIAAWDSYDYVFLSS